jgi:hypothetical protein
LRRRLRLLGLRLRRHRRRSAYLRRRGYRERLAALGAVDRLPVILRPLLRLNRVRLPAMRARNLTCLCHAPPMWLLMRNRSCGFIPDRCTAAECSARFAKSLFLLLLLLNFGLIDDLLLCR